MHVQSWGYIHVAGFEVQWSSYQHQTYNVHVQTSTRTCTWHAYTYYKPSRFPVQISRTHRHLQPPKVHKCSWLPTELPIAPQEVIPTYSFAELVEMKQPQFLVCLFFSHCIPVDKIRRVEKSLIESTPVSLDSSGEVRPSAFHWLEKEFRVERPQLWRRL